MVAKNFLKYRIVITDRAGAQKAFFSSTASGILRAEWELAANGGCTNAVFAVKKGYPGTIANGYLIDIFVTRTDGTEEKHWSGRVSDVTGTGATSQVVEVNCVGLWEQLENTIIIDYYASATCESIVKSLHTNYYANTDIANDQTQISITSDYSMGDFECEYLTWSEALDKLATLQKDVNYGVNQNRRLYFKDKTATNNEHIWVGRHINALDHRLDSRRLINHYLLQAKGVASGAMFTLSRTDTTSVTNYGRRTKVIQLPELPDLNDVWRYGEQLLAENKNPVTMASTDVMSINHFRFPEGNARTITADGTELSLPIISVRYSLDPNAGIVGRLELGDKPQTTLISALKDADRSITIARDAAASTTRIEHSRGEEWMQTALVNARRQGNYNFFADTFQTIKLINQEASIKLYWDDRRKFLGQDITAQESYPNNDKKSIVVSQTIPCGQVVNTIRVHADCDFYGTIDFLYERDLEEYFLNTTNWRYFDTASKVADTEASDLLYYKDDAGWTFPVNYTMRFSIIDWDTDRSTATDPAFTYNYNAGTGDYNRITFRDRPTPTTATWLWVKHVSGGDTTLQTVNVVRHADYECEIEVRNDPATSTLRGYQIGGTDTFTVTGTAPSAAGNRCYWRNFFNSPEPSAWLGQVELREIGDINIYVSRNGGTNWTQASIGHGENNVNVNVSGQPSGTDIVLKAEITSPARLYGWGWSLKPGT